MKDILLRNRDTNQTEEFVNAMVENMKYCDSSVVYPSYEVCRKGDVPAELFYEAYAGLGNNSERTAIHQYVTMQAKYEELGTLMLGIAIVEMKHMDRLGDLITTLGGTLDQKWNNDSIEYGDDPKSALELAIEGEEATIKSYQNLIAKLASYKNLTAETCIQLLNKLIADEVVHLNLFKKALEDFND